MKRIALPLAGWLTVLLCVVYLLAGLPGHDPWKTQDAVNLGIAWEFADAGDWLNPRIGHEPWFGNPPLYHWCAALLGHMLRGLMPFHSGARLSTAIWGGLLLLGLALAGRELKRDTTSPWVTPLLTMGTLGLLVPIHDAEPMVILLAAQAFLLLGLARIPDRPASGGAISGIAFGCAFLAMGSTALPFCLAMTTLPLLQARWRSPRSLAGLALALLSGLALCCLWPALLAAFSPEHLPPWWNAELAKIALRRLDGSALQDHLELLGWAAWPILPLAAWAVWVKRRQLSDPAVFIPLMASLTALAQIVALSDPQPLPHLLLVVPLSLLAATGIDRLRRGAANALDWFGMMTFSLAAALIWLGGYSMATGSPARVAKNFLKAEPGFVGEISLPLFAIAGVATMVWLGSLMYLPRSPWRGVTHWSLGLTLTWSLLATLWMPWLDYGKTYRPVAASLQAALGDSRACVRAQGVGMAQKASLRYFVGLATEPGKECPWLLTQGNARRESAPTGWKKIWDGARSGDKSEKLRLYWRDTKAGTAAAGAGYSTSRATGS